MSAVLEISTIGGAKEAVVHMMPCTISHTGEASVDQYFNSSIRTSKESNDKDTTATFRGRPLNGCDIEVPEGYTGLIMKENRKPFNEDEERNFKVTHKFRKFSFWNLDKTPSVNDKIQQALDWIDIAKSIHSVDNTVDEVNSQNSVGGEK